MLYFMNLISVYDDQFAQRRIVYKLNENKNTHEYT